MFINEEDKLLLVDVIKEELYNKGITKGKLTNSHKTAIINSLIVSGVDLESANALLAEVVPCF